MDSQHTAKYNLLAYLSVFSYQSQLQQINSRSLWTS